MRESHQHPTKCIVLSEYSNINRNGFAIKIYYYDDSPRLRDFRIVLLGQIANICETNDFKGTPAVRDKQRSLENSQYSKEKMHLIVLSCKITDH